MSRIPAEWFGDYPKHFGFKPEDTGSDEAEFIRQVLHLRKGSALLDAPCGAGRVSIHLARRGVRITGVDLTPAYIGRARERFAQEKLAARFLVSDLRAIEFENEFDGVLNWQGSFGFFSDGENLDVVRRYARSLRRGGRLVIDQPNREYLLRHFQTRGRNGDVEQRVRWNAAQERFETRFHNRQSGESWGMTIRSYTPGQFARLYRQAGLEVEGFYGDLAGLPYRRGARRIYVVCRKP